MAGNFWKSSHCQQWIWDKQELEINRRKDVTTLEGIQNYHKLMTIFINIIQDVGEKLKVRQQVIATATIYLKRFYSRYGLKCTDPLLMAPTCLFLASKVEEYGVINHTRLMAVTGTAVKSRLPFLGQEYGYRVSHLHECEFYLLELMDCCLIVYHPYRPLLQYIEDFGHKEKVLQLCWRICNDLLRTDVPLLYSPHQQALASLYMAASSLDIDCRQWFVDLSVSMEPIIEIINMLLQYYQIIKSITDEKKEHKDLWYKSPKAVVEGKSDSTSHSQHRSIGKNSQSSRR